MTWVFLFIVATGLGVVGYWRGSMRVMLSLAPLLLASVFIWLLAGLVGSIGFIARAGLMWPYLIPTILGLVTGYVLQYFLRKKLPKDLHIVDRVAGAAICVVVSFVIVWVGSLYISLREYSQSGEYATLDISSARRLNSVVRWIPAVGAGSDTLMGVVEIASAQEDVRQRAVEELGIGHLLDSEILDQMTNDEKTMADLESAGRGNPLAIWRLQKNPYIVEFYNSPEVQAILKDLSLEDISQAVENARSGTASDPRQ